MDLVVPVNPIPTDAAALLAAYTGPLQAFDLHLTFDEVATAAEHAPRFRVKTHLGAPVLLGATAEDLDELLEDRADELAPPGGCSQTSPGIRSSGARTSPDCSSRTPR